MLLSLQSYKYLHIKTKRKVTLAGGNIRTQNKKLAKLVLIYRASNHLPIQWGFLDRGNETQDVTRNIVSLGNIIFNVSWHIRCLIFSKEKRWPGQIVLQKKKHRIQSIVERTIGEGWESCPNGYRRCRRGRTILKEVSSGYITRI